MLLRDGAARSLNLLRAMVSRNAGRRALIVALELSLAAVALWSSYRFFAQVPIAAPFQYDYAEGSVLSALLRITQGATPYPDPQALPNSINIYGPVAYYLLALPVKVLGLTLLYPRAMILGCAVAIAVLISIKLWRTTRSIALALTFGLIYLTIPNIQSWAWLLRVDLLGIAFTIAGLIVFSQRFDRERAGVLAALLFAAGLLVKVTLIAAPAACFLALISRRRFREAAVLAGVTAASFGLVMAAFAVVTHGAALVHIFLTHADPFLFRRYAEGLAGSLKASWPLVLLASVATAYDIAQRRFSPPILWLLLATATAITAGKFGASSNHFLEWNTSLCLAAGLGMHKLINLQARTVALATTAISVIATATLLVVRKPPDFTTLEFLRGCPQAYEWVRTQSGSNLLAENVGALVLGNKRVWVSDPYALAHLVRRAGWSDAGLARMVRERRFDAVIARKDHLADPSNLTTGTSRFSPEVLRALSEGYVPEPGFQCRDMGVLFKPRTTPAIQRRQVHGTPGESER